MPLLLSHGWPGSIVEFQKIIPMLTDPRRFGGDASDAFTVVAPSLPGYTLSFEPGQPRFGCVEIAEIFASLMTDVLGYSRFAAQGGDWGGQITSRLGYAFADRVIGIHLNLLVRRDPAQSQDPTPEEKIFLNELNHYLKEETGYQWIQGTKPTTLSFGLTDSPVGLAAWIVEKFQSWTQNRGAIEDAVSRDDLLSNIVLYWATGAIGSSFWPYYERAHSPALIPDGERIRCRRATPSFPRISSICRDRGPSASMAISSDGPKWKRAAISPLWSSPSFSRGRSARFSVRCVRELLGLKVLRKFKGTLHGGNETTLFLMSRTTCTSAWSL